MAEWVAASSIGLQGRTTYYVPGAVLSKRLGPQELGEEVEGGDLEDMTWPRNLEPYAESRSKDCIGVRECS